MFTLITLILSDRKMKNVINVNIFYSHFQKVCAFIEELAIKWLHTLLGKTQLFMRTGI